MLFDMLFDKDLLQNVPAVFHPELQRYQTLFAERAAEAEIAALKTCLDAEPILRQQLLRVWLGSEYAAQACIANPGMLISILQQASPTLPLVADTLAPELALQLRGCAGEQQLDRVLRCYRQHTMVRIIWRDLNHLATLEETTGALSALADACIQRAMDFHYRDLAQKWGTPIGRESGQPQPLLVLAMGKLGAGELNLSSDVDLIFAYPESGETDAERKNLANQEFFSRLGKKLIKSLDANTAEGFVFRVDMRLRPYGQSGALVLNFDALEDYYQTQGREWERYAMIKARVAAVAAIPDVPGGDAAADKLLSLLRPFTYRKYIDYSAVEALRSMKALISREVRRKGMREDVKLGLGGIREIEFIVQAFQLIRGGRDEHLQERRLLRLLPALEARDCLPAGAAERLAHAYRFLRNTEHALQAYQDRQTQTLPTAPVDRQRLAWVMGYAGWEAFAGALEAHRAAVNAEFQAVIADPHQDAGGDRDQDWVTLWKAPPDRDQAVSFLSTHYADARRVVDLLEQLRESRHVLAMQAAGRERLDEFLPRLLGAVAERGETAETLARILRLVEAVARRSAYLVLLIENPGALKQLITLCAASPWIADQLVKYPALLDELLDPRSLYAPPDKESLRDELRREVLRLGWDDLEGHMEALRYFKAAHALRVAASEVTDVLPLMKVSDYLTYIAEVILEHVAEVAWRQMIDRHGYPCAADGSRGEFDFVIIGYGKLGGIELGHGSDLDLVFLHHAEAGRYTDGDRQLDNQTFYTRLGQKIIHILTAQTVGGKLYDVDMRLRPSGNSGLLVSSLAGFEKYQLTDAWTWEHQALVRARVVAGSAPLARAFEAVRAKVLGQQRELTGLQQQVTQMRAKMRGHLGTQSDAQGFNLKHDRGGIVDIEFMVQYAVLAWACRDAALVRYSDNIRILNCLEEAGLLGTQEVSQLIDAYKAYRSMGHRLALQGEVSVLNGTQFAAERETVTRIWQRLLGSS